MNTENSELKLTKNSVIWIAIFVFVVGAGYRVGIESNALSSHFLFSAALAWSAFCCIGYSVSDWFQQRKIAYSKVRL